MNKPSFVLTASVLVLSACTTMKAGGPAAQLDPQLCNSTGIHCRKVTIRHGQIEAVPDVDVRMPNSQIYWEIVTDGYEFDRARGIEFKSGQVIPVHEFQCNRVLRTVYHCSDAGQTKGTFRYAILVTDGSTPVRFDPQIVNH